MLPSDNRLDDLDASLRSLISHATAVFCFERLSAEWFMAIGNLADALERSHVVATGALKQLKLELTR